MMTSLRLIEKVAKVNTTDVTCGLLEKYNSEGKLIEYVVARNPVEKVGEFVNYTWDSGDYFSVAFVNPLEAKADAYDMLMCRAGYREEPNYRKADEELERVVSYEDMETIARNAIDMIAEAEYDSSVSVDGLTDEHKEELADNLGINTEEAKEYFGLQVQRFKKMRVTATVTETYEFEIALPEGVTDWEYDNYVDNMDFEDIVDCSKDYDYDYGVERIVNRDEAEEVGRDFFFEKEI